MVTTGSPPASVWIHAFGTAVDLGEPSPLPREVVALEASPIGPGYWVTGVDGSVFGFEECATSVRWSSGSPRLLSGSDAQAVRDEVASLQPGYGRC